jgi:RES domain-containing protein
MDPVEARIPAAPPSGSQTRGELLKHTLRERPADSPVALAIGDGWLKEQRTAALVVPAVPSRPIGRNVLINPEHPDVGKIAVSDAFIVPWDERLF